MENFLNDYRLNEGSLNTNPPQRRSTGKKIAEWTFNAKGSKVPVPVSVFLTYRSGAFSFRAESPQLPKKGPFSDGFVESDDINKLRTLVEQTLLSKASEISGIVWEDWLEVVVEGNTKRQNPPRSEGGESETFKKETIGAALTIKINPLKRGINPESHQPVTINTNGLVVPFPQPSSIRDQKDDPEVSILLTPVAEKSYVPDTPKNRLALEEILNRLTELRDKLANFLGQDLVGKSLNGGVKQLELSGREDR